MPYTSKICNPNTKKKRNFPLYFPLVIQRQHHICLGLEIMGQKVHAPQLLAEGRRLTALFCIVHWQPQTWLNAWGCASQAWRLQCGECYASMRGALLGASLTWSALFRPNHRCCFSGREGMCSPSSHQHQLQPHSTSPPPPPMLCSS